MNQVESFTKQTHSTSAMLYALSRLFERAGYYGLRSVFVIYLTSKTVGFQHDEALTVYGWYLMTIVIAKMLGAILGDLLIGNRLSVIIGMLFSFLGALTLFILGDAFLIIGVILIISGTGLYCPNCIALFGKDYRNKSRIIDSAYGLFFIGVNIGAFTGVMVVTYISIVYGYDYGFLSGAVLYGIGLLIVLFTVEKSLKGEFKSVYKGSKRLILVVSAIIISTVFWSLFEYASADVIMIESYIDDTRPSFDHISLSTFISQINAFVMIILSSIITVVWYYFYSNSLMKLLVGLLLALISYGIILLVPEVQSGGVLILFIFSTFLLSLSEIFIVPSLMSIITLNGNYKYLAIIFASGALLTSLSLELVYGVRELLNSIIEIKNVSIYITIIVLVIITGGVFILYSFNKERDREIE